MCVVSVMCVGNEADEVNMVSLVDVVCEVSLESTINVHVVCGECIYGECCKCCECGEGASTCSADHVPCVRD